MSTINLQKLGLPSSPRIKEIIEEDYPAVSLQNRMKMIQLQFAQRQNQEPKDISKPPETQTDVKFQFDTIANELIGQMKRFIGFAIPSMKLSNIMALLQTYIKLATVYNAYVMPLLPSQELFRREVYAKLDIIAQAAGMISAGILQNRVQIEPDVVRPQIMGIQDIQGRQQHQLNPQQQQAALQGLPNQTIANIAKVFEQIRRDALTRILRTPDWVANASITYPLPGQPREYQPPGEPGAPQDQRFTGRIIAGPGQPPAQPPRPPQIIQGFDQPGGPYPIDGPQYPIDGPIYDPQNIQQIRERQRQERQQRAQAIQGARQGIQEAMPERVIGPEIQRDAMVRNIDVLLQNVPRGLEGRVENYLRTVLNNAPIGQLQEQQLIDLTNYLTNLQGVPASRERVDRESLQARLARPQEEARMRTQRERDEAALRERERLTELSRNPRQLMIENLVQLHNAVPEELEDRVQNYITQVLGNVPPAQLSDQQLMDFTNYLRNLQRVIPDRQRMERETALARQRREESEREEMGSEDTRQARRQFEQEDQEFEEARQEPSRQEMIDFIIRQFSGSNLDAGYKDLLRRHFNLGNLRPNILRQRIATYHPSVLGRLYRLSREEREIEPEEA